MFGRKCILVAQQVSLANRCFSNTSLSHLTKQATVNFGSELYPKLRQEWPKLYRRIPRSGLNLTIDYLDTKRPGHEYRKVVVAVHGMPDTFHTFAELATHYLDTDVRLIAPNLPDFTHTRRHNFWHTSNEKSDFLRSFLSQLEIDTIDCLVSHSFGTMAIGGLWQESPQLKVKSTLLCAPQTLLAVEVDQMYKQGQQLLYFPYEWWYRFLDLFKLHEKGILKIKVKDIDEFLICIAGAFDQNAKKEMEDRLDRLVEFNIPVAVLFGSREYLITKKAVAELDRTLKIAPDQVIQFDPTKDSIDKLNLNNRRNSIMVNGAGHFVHAKFPSISNKLADELLRLAHDS